ncbi:putative hydrolase of the HAD superfamily [Winogradskyella pacifica]|uniref:Putative hydrolase of the HAD superfamily n=1 Tax=Winogradskyella pacifica TaxID=664642 RepID=A0A3D9N245_9FLAO|nr:HAD family hydrolase [Winogradskyella pacifica]REE25788.1 putative hydrolase of the HAD superfamily [Winogradskyella pacifica]
MDIKINETTVVVFDLDDTLYNELDYLRSAYKSIAIFVEPKDWKALYSKMFSLYRCKFNVFEFVANTYKIEIGHLVEMYRNHQPDIQLFEGVLEVFDAIKSKNGKIGIITDGRSKTQRAKLESLGILNYLDKIIISEEIGSEKPSSANFEAIENALTGAEYYYIADNLKKDFLAPNALGWKSVALIDNGKNIHSESHMYMEAKHRPKAFVIDFSDFNIS